MKGIIHATANGLLTVLVVGTLTGCGSVASYRHGPQFAALSASLATTTVSATSEPSGYEPATIDLLDGAAETPSLDATTHDEPVVIVDDPAESGLASEPPAAPTVITVAASDEPVATAPEAPIAPQSCAANNGCARGHCGGHLQKLREWARDYDWEQLYPDHCWPEQYVLESRRRVYKPFGDQMKLGDEFERTLWPHYFSTAEDQTGELTEGGRSRLRYLARKKPYVVRELFLQTSFDPSVDEKRIQAITAFLDKHVAPDGSGAVEGGWTVRPVDRGPTPGLAGVEAIYSMDKMLGTETLVGGTPRFHQQIKQTFMSTGGTSVATGPR
jgi:hypothetical protein